MPAETSLAICSAIFGGVFDRLPGLRLAFAHGGGAFPGTIGRIEHAFHVRPDLCAVNNGGSPRSYLGRFWVDSIVHDAKTLKDITDLFGHARVALGTDYPFPLGESAPGELIESMSFDDHIRGLLLSGSGLEWLGESTSFDGDGVEPH
jgi:aminocarboxymuconate-semialdehyde decarboxylase